MTDIKRLLFGIALILFAIFLYLLLAFDGKYILVAIFAVAGLIFAIAGLDGRKTPPDDDHPDRQD